MAQTKTRNSSSSKRSSDGSSGGVMAEAAKKAKGPMSKARGPVVAGAAAAAGLAAGAALSRNSSRKRLGVSKPKLAKALATTAKEIGKAGYRAGELTAEVRRAREQIIGRK